MSVSPKDKIPEGFVAVEEPHAAGQLFVHPTKMYGEVIADYDDVFCYVNGRIARHKCPGRHVKDGARIPCGRNVTAEVWGAAKLSAEADGREHVFECPTCGNEIHVKRFPEPKAAEIEEAPEVPLTDDPDGDAEE